MSIKMAISENSAEVSGSDYAGVGECLRTLRLRSGHSLRSLAERSGLNINTLSLIEHNRTSPSVHTLERLARALDVPITAFFEPEKDLKQVVFTRHDARPNATFEMASVGSLAKNLDASSLQLFVTTLAPGAQSGEAGMKHNGYEFAYCLSGSMQYWIADREYVLEPGDSLVFQARLLHRWQNPTGETAEILLVLFDTTS